MAARERESERAGEKSAFVRDSFTLRPEEVATVDRLAREQDRSRSAVVRRAIRLLDEQEGGK